MAEPISIRMGLTGRIGRSVEQLSNPSIHADSVIHISVSEANISLQPQVNPQATNSGGPGGDGGPDGPTRPETPVLGERFLGAADVWIKNISPQEGAVRFVLFVDWNSPLGVAVDITIFDPPGGSLIGQ